MSYRESSYKGNQIEIRNKVENEFPILFDHITTSSDYNEFLSKIKDALENLSSNFTNTTHSIYSREAAVLRLLTLLKNENMVFNDPIRSNQQFKSRPFYWLWQAVKEEETIATQDFFDDFFHLLQQSHGLSKSNSISKEELIETMFNLPKATDVNIIAIRENNKARVIKGLVNIIENSKKQHSIFYFTETDTPESKIEKLNLWWNDYRFHLRFAIRTVEQLQLVMNNNLPKAIVANFEEGLKKGIPIFINPYYLSLIYIGENGEFDERDRTIRDYVFYSKNLIETFGNISAWEKEDLIEEGKPNAAGWLLPAGGCVHRRYPEVAIYIPEGRGRACAGLCASCQRMYGFQNNQLNFEMEEENISSSKGDRVKDILNYFETDSHLQDILITGGDALMNTNSALKQILADVLSMIERKKTRSKACNISDRIAIIQRIRLGSRILAYLPQRIDTELIDILADFKTKAYNLGVKQFVLQTHFESTMELTTEAVNAIEMLRESGWLIVNQQVFTASASRRSKSMQLRRELNKNGVLPYYTFSVKGFKENIENAAPVARLAQEVHEEKCFGLTKTDRSNEFFTNPKENHLLFRKIEQEESVPFVATDRSILNLPAMGKSLSFEQIGITIDGRRILSFEHDHHRNHSPAVNESQKVIIVESKSIASYLRQLKSMGEDTSKYESIFCFSSGSTENRSEVFQYPQFDFELTKNYNHCEY